MVAALTHYRPDPLVQYLRLVTEHDLITSAARDDFRMFCARMYPGYLTGPHIQTMTAALTETVETPNSRTIVTMPPRHSKSLHVSENLPAWFIGRYPDNRVIASSHSQSLANTFSRRVRAKINDPRWPFPDVRIADDKGAVEAWDIAGHRGGYVAVGVGGSPTGHGANLIVIDDPIRNAADADSQTIRDSQWEWYQGTIRTRLEPGGSIVITATRWHDDDLTGRLLEAARNGGEQWRHIHMPAIDTDGQALWPERWPVADLERIRNAVGTRAWTAQYQGTPQLAEGGTFKRTWWQRYSELPEDVARVEIYVDSAFKTGVGNDFSVCAVWASDKRGNAYLVNIFRGRVEFPELIAMGAKAWQWARDAFPGIAVSLVPEDKASGQSAIQVWQRENHIPVVSYSIKATDSKISRAEAVTPFVEGKRVFIPQSAPFVDDWLDEHDRFPNGAHDDQVDTTSMALQRLLLEDPGNFTDLPAVTVTMLEELYG